MFKLKDYTNKKIDLFKKKIIANDVNEELYMVKGGISYKYNGFLEEWEPCSKIKPLENSKEINPEVEKLLNVKFVLQQKLKKFKNQGVK